ncbi:MAG: hypothetical protein AAF800_02060 [Planctomycetota bacterium]
MSTVSISPKRETAAAEPPEIDAGSHDATQRILAYLVALGVGPASADRVAEALDRRIDPAVTNPAERAAAMLEGLDRWADGLPQTLGLADTDGRVAFALATHLGPLLDRHPEAIDRSDAAAEMLREPLNHYPNGLLPDWPRRGMPRQPLGELPSVLTGEFWSGTYRWVMPAVDRGVRGMRSELSPPPGTPGIPGTPAVAGASSSEPAKAPDA